MTDKVCTGWVAVAATILMWGCQVDLDSTTKDRCFVQTDCLTGYTCVNSFCVEAGTDTGERDTLETDTRDATSDSGVDSAEDTRVADTGAEEDTADVILTGLDEDNDQIDDGIDNCRGIANPAQEDYDNNGTGDFCQQEERTSLVISEIMINPEAGLGPSDGGGVLHEWALEYVEIYNAGRRPVDMSGFVLSNLAGQQVVIPAQGGDANVIPPEGFFVISGVPLRDASDREIHGWSHGTPGFTIANGEGADGATAYERLVLSHPLTDGGGTERLIVDQVELFTPSPRGRAWILLWETATGTLPAIRNNSETAWCEAWYALTDGRDAGSPGARSGPCYRVAQLQCDSSPGRELPLGQAVYGDLVDESAGQDSLNHCPSITTPATGRDLIYRLKVDQETPVELVLTPLPNVEGDQKDPNATLTEVPWYHLIYWREGVCPTGGFQFEPSVCLQPGDGTQTSTLLLKKGVTYYFAVDGHARSSTPLVPEHGRFTLRLSPL